MVRTNGPTIRVNEPTKDTHVVLCNRRTLWSRSRPEIIAVLLRNPKAIGFGRIISWPFWQAPKPFSNLCLRCGLAWVSTGKWLLLRDTYNTVTKWVHKFGTEGYRRYRALSRLGVEELNDDPSFASHLCQPRWWPDSSSRTRGNQHQQPLNMVHIGTEMSWRMGEREKVEWRKQTWSHLAKVKVCQHTWNVNYTFCIMLQHQNSHFPLSTGCRRWTTHLLSKTQAFDQKTACWIYVMQHDAPMFDIFEIPENPENLQLVYFG